MFELKLHVATSPTNTASEHQPNRKHTFSRLSCFIRGWNQCNASQDPVSNTCIDHQTATITPPPPPPPSQRHSLAHQQCRSWSVAELKFGLHISGYSRCLLGLKRPQGEVIPQRLEPRHRRRRRWTDDWIICLTRCLGVRWPALLRSLPPRNKQLCGCSWKENEWWLSKSNSCV